MKINQYKIELWNILSPIESEYLQKIVNDQLRYMHNKGLIENSHMMVSVENMNTKSVYVESNKVSDLK